MMDNTAVENKAQELINAGVLRVFQHHFTENDVKLEVSKLVESPDLVKPVTQKILTMAESGGLIGEASWYAYHAGFIKLTAILSLILAAVTIYRTW